MYYELYLYIYESIDVFSTILFKFNPNIFDKSHTLFSLLGTWAWRMHAWDGSSNTCAHHFWVTHRCTWAWRMHVGTGVVTLVHITFESYTSLGHVRCNNNNIDFSWIFRFASMLELMVWLVWVMLDLWTLKSLFIV